MNLTSDRLVIRPFLAEDWPQLQRIARDFSAGPYALYDHALPADDEGIRQAAAYFAGSGGYYSVCLADGVMIGYARLALLQGEAELGYCFHSEYHGRGYAFEACSALMEYIRTEEEVFSFAAGTALDNTPSCRLLARLGFELVETAEVSFHKDADGRDIPFEAGLFVRVL